MTVSRYHFLIKEIIDGIQYLKSRHYQSSVIREIELLSKSEVMLPKNIKIIKDICARMDIEWLDEYNGIDHEFVLDLKSRNCKILKSRFNNPIKTLFNLHYSEDYKVIGIQRNGGNFIKRLKMSDFDAKRNSLNYIYINSAYSSDLYEDTTRKYLKSTPNLFKCYTYWDEGVDEKYDLPLNFVNDSIVNNGITDVRALEMIDECSRAVLNEGLLLFGSIIRQAKYMRDNYVSDDAEFSMILPSIHKVYYELIDHIDMNLTKSDLINMFNIVSEIYGCRFIILHKHKKVLNEEMSSFKECDLLFIHMGIK